MQPPPAAPAACLPTPAPRAPPARLAFIPDTVHSATVAGQIIDVAVRVEDVRPFAVQSLLPMLADPQLATNARARVAAAGSAPPAPVVQTETAGEGSTAAAMATVAAGGHALYAAAWIVGEYAAVIPPAMHSAVLDALMQPAVLGLPAVIPAVYVQAALKLLAVAAAAAVKSGDAASFIALASSVAERLNPFAQCVHVDVQERACLVQQLLAALGVPFKVLSTPASEAAERARAEEELMNLVASAPAAPKAAPPPPDVRAIAATLAALFDEPLKPVNPKAQRKVPVPAGLNLDAWIHPEEARNFDADERPAKTGSAFRYENVRCAPNVRASLVWLPAPSAAACPEPSALKTRTASPTTSLPAAGAPALTCQGPARRRSTTSARATRTMRSGSPTSRGRTRRSSARSTAAAQSPRAARRARLPLLLPPRPRRPRRAEAMTRTCCARGAAGRR